MQVKQGSFTRNSASLETPGFGLFFSNLLITDSKIDQTESVKEKVRRLELDD
jgi:hypothetical protein